VTALAAAGLLGTAVLAAAPASSAADGTTSLATVLKAGQAKFVSVLSGSVIDVLLDVRLGSPTFGEAVVVELDAGNRRAVAVPVGVAHGFLALEPNSTVVYFTDHIYSPAAERSITPFDPAVQSALGTSTRGLALSVNDRDRTAPTLDDARRLALLPRWSGSATVDRRASAAQTD